MPSKTGNRKTSHSVSGSLYKQIFDQSPELIAFTNPEGTILKISRRIFDWLGYRPDEIIGKKYSELEIFNSKTREMLMKKFSQRVSGEGMPPYNIDLVAKDGRQYVGQFVGRLIRKDNGEIRGILVVISDVTKQVEQAMAFRDMSEKNKALFQAIPDMIFIMNKDGTFVEFKADREEDLAVSPDKIIGSNIRDYHFSESFLELVKNAVNEAVRSRRVQTFEYKMDIPGGTGFYECRMAALNDREVLSVIRNITKHKELDKELRLKNTVFETSIAANSTADIKGEITTVNQSFLEIWGFHKKSEVIGRHVSDFFQDREEADTILRGLNNIGIWRGEFTGKKKDGSTFACRGFASVVQGSDGQVMGYQSTNVDLSRLRKAVDTPAGTDEER